MPWPTPNTLGTGTDICRPLFIPNDLAIVEAVSGALLDLTYARNWEPDGEIEPDEIAARMLAMLEQYFAGECAVAGFPIGTIFAYVTADPPAGSIPCDGAEYASTDYPALWSIINPAWKTDATHWRAPDPRDRFPAGVGPGEDAGDQGGSIQFTLAHNQLPHGTGFLDANPSGGVLSGLRYLVSSPANVQARYFLSGYGTPVTHIPPYELWTYALQVE